MPQHKIMINDKVIKQPSSDMSYSFETTYSSDTKRTQTGKLVASPVYTAESFGYSVGNISVEEAQVILKELAKGKFFKLHYWSPYYSEWRDGYFYVGKGSLSIGSLSESRERYSSLSFNMIGRDPI